MPSHTRSARLRVNRSGYWFPVPGNGPWSSGAGWASTARFLARKREEFADGYGAKTAATILPGVERLAVDPTSSIPI